MNEYDQLPLLPESAKDARRVLIAPHNQQWADVVRSLWPLCDLDVAQPDRPDLTPPPKDLYTTWWTISHAAIYRNEQEPLAWYDVFIFDDPEIGVTVHARTAQQYIALTDRFALMFPAE